MAVFPDFMLSLFKPGDAGVVFDLNG